MDDLNVSPAYVPFTPPLSSVEPQKPEKKSKELFKKLTMFFTEKRETFSGQTLGSNNFYVKGTQSLRNIKRRFKRTYILPVILILVVFAAIYLITRSFTGNSSSVLSDSDQRVSIKKAKAQQIINKEFLFSLKDSKGKEVSKIKYFIQDAQLQDEIVVKGQRATAVRGRTFLIVYLKITNDYSSDISLKTRDYMRLMVNGSAEKLAPDIHNDPVEIQAISTKYTRLGFPVNDTDKNLILQVGEISGNKQNIKLDKLK